MKLNRKTISALLLSSVIAGFATAAMAGGTAPGTTIKNSIDLSYTSGGNPVSVPNAASVSFLVDRKVNFSIVGQDAGANVVVQQGASGQYQTYLLTNSGNDASGYDINVANNGTIGLTYDPTAGGALGTYSVWVGSTLAPSSSDVLYNANGTTNIGDVAVDGKKYIHIKANIPNTAKDASSDLFTVTATALDAGTNTVTQATANPSINTVDTVLADASGTGVENDKESYTVSAPQLTGTKVSQVVSENLNGTFNCATGTQDPNAQAFVPGACIEYTITVTNGSGATSAASGLTVTDPLPANVTYAAIFGTHPGFDTVTYSGGTITGTAASLAAGASATMHIRATVN